MIKDPELRDIFHVESNEYLQQIEAGLLKLEKTPDDTATLKELFRMAHSLKGSSRMLGQERLVRVAHIFEDVLGMAAKGSLTFDAGIIDTLTRGLDGMARLVEEAVKEDAVPVDVDAVVADLDFTKNKPSDQEPSPIAVVPGEPSQSAPPSERHPLQSPFPKDPSSKEASPAPAPEAPPRASDAPVQSYRVDTIRVEPKKLDRLINQVSELAVTRTRLRQRLADADELLDLAADMEKSLAPVFSSVFGAEAAQEQFGRMIQSLEQLKQNMYEDNTGLEFTARDLEEGVLNLRLLPLSTIFTLFPRMVRDLARDLDKKAELAVTGADTTVDKYILEEMKNPLTHLIRNGIHHGLESPAERRRAGKPETGTLRLHALRTATHVVIELSDDGRGIDLGAVREKAVSNKLLRPDEADQATEEQLLQLLFQSGFSTSRIITDISGRGVGLDVVQTQVAKMKGTVKLDSLPGKGCRFSIQLPVSLTTSRVFIIRLDRHRYAVPIDFVEQTRQVMPDKVFSVEGRAAIDLDGIPVSVMPLAELLEIPCEKPPGIYGPCLILVRGRERVGLVVDDIEDELEVVVKPHKGVLKRVRNVNGATILGDGSVCMVLDPPDLIREAAGFSRNAPVSREDPEADGPETAQASPGHILLVEDSITTRTQEKRILESAGYLVTAAVDGLDGWNKLSGQTFDAVVSDVEMPNLTGLDLTRRIRESGRFKELPVILVTSLSNDEDRRRGMEVGANAYISKPGFDQTLLLDTLRRLM